jgi:DNA-binding response OmpR family regulator
VSEGAQPNRVVIVVDDDDVIRRVVRTVLEADDFAVIEARDGREALELASQGKASVMVLDVMMPGLDGVEVCRQVDHGRTKVIILTARDDPDVEEASLAAGADGFLAKPFSSVELLDRVEDLAARG